MANALIIYGSLTGNTEGVANKIQSLMAEKGKEVTIKNAGECGVADLTGPEPILILASSTWDDGLLQADFADFLERIASEKPNLSAKKMAFFGCGDSNYNKFCGAIDILESEFTGPMAGQKIVESLRIDGFPESEENQTSINNWVENLATLI
jgi:flavodoxin short chain